MVISAPLHFFTQSAVIPYRIRLLTRKLEICLITNRRGTRWILPKGVVEPSLSPQASAAKEAWEEAGVKGIVMDRELGSYSYGKWGGLCTVTVYPMRVKTILRYWPESYRERRWFSLEEAMARIDDPELKPMLKSLPQALG